LGYLDLGKRPGRQKPGVESLVVNDLIEDFRRYYVSSGKRNTLLENVFNEGLLPSKKDVGTNKLFGRIRGKTIPKEKFADIVIPVDLASNLTQKYYYASRPSDQWALDYSGFSKPVNPALFFRVLEHMKDRYSYPSCIRQPNTFVDTADLVKTGSPGFPFNQLFKTKGEVLEVFRDQILLYARFPFMNCSLGGQQRALVVNFPKVEMRKDGKDTRCISCFDVLVHIMTMVMSLDFNIQFYDGDKVFQRDWFSAVGLNKFSGGWNRLYMTLLDGMPEGTLALSLDVKSCDTSHKIHLQQFSKLFRLHCLELSGEFDRKTLLKYLNQLYNIKNYSTVIDYDGTTYMHYGGVLSGNFDTIVDNTIHVMCDLLYAWYSLAPSGYDSPAAFEKHIRVRVYGDDIILTATPEVQNWFTFEAIAASLDTIGIKMKCNNSSGAYQELHRCEFLSHTFAQYRGMQVPVGNVDKHMHNFFSTHGGTMLASNEMRSFGYTANSPVGTQAGLNLLVKCALYRELFFSSSRARFRQERDRFFKETEFNPLCPFYQDALAEFRKTDLDLIILYTGYQSGLMTKVLATLKTNMPRNAKQQKKPEIKVVVQKSQQKKAPIKRMERIEKKDHALMQRVVREVRSVDRFRLPPECQRLVDAATIRHMQVTMNPEVALSGPATIPDLNVGPVAAFAIQTRFTATASAAGNLGLAVTGHPSFCYLTSTDVDTTPGALSFNFGAALANMVRATGTTSYTTAYNAVRMVAMRVTVRSNGAATSNAGSWFVNRVNPFGVYNGVAPGGTVPLLDSQVLASATMSSSASGTFAYDWAPVGPSCFNFVSSNQASGVTTEGTFRHFGYFRGVGLPASSTYTVTIVTNWEFAEPNFNSGTNLFLPPMMSYCNVKYWDYYLNKVIGCARLGKLQSGASAFLPTISIPIVNAMEAIEEENPEIKQAVSLPQNRPKPSVWNSTVGAVYGNPSGSFGSEDSMRFDPDRNAGSQPEPTIQPAAGHRYDYVGIGVDHKGTQGDWGDIAVFQDKDGHRIELPFRDSGGSAHIKVPPPEAVQGYIIVPDSKKS